METKGEGWLIFAAIALGVAGIMRIFDSIWAFRVHNVVLPEGTLGDNIRNYAWLWLIVGILLILCAFAVAQRSQFARWVGIVAGAVFYAGAHFMTGDPLLIGAAVACGLFWGLLYAATDDLVAPIASHVVWDVLVMFVAPLV